MYQEPLISRGISHYYGDIVRIMFLLVVLIGFIAVPLWGAILPLGLFFEVLGGLIFVFLAGVINPRSTWPIFLSIIASAIGAFLLEATAIAYKHESSTLLFLAREASVILLVIALYFSVKTIRAMAQGNLGIPPATEEVENASQSNEHESYL